MSDRLKDKVAIVTGAGRGIGKAEAIALAAEGASVLVNDLGVARDGTGADASPADQTVAEIKALGGAAAANHDDITVIANGGRIVKQAVDTFGRLDILVNNAGIQINRPVFEITEDEWDRTIAIHLKGHWSMIRAAIEVMREQGGGSIVNTGSMAGLGQLRHVDYCAAKEGIIGMTRALALELLPFNIRVNDVRPRALTRMITERRPEEMGERERQMQQQAPAATAGPDPNRDPAMIGAMVVFLASDAAASVTGRDFFVQGNEISLMTLPVKERSIIREGGWDADAIERAFPSAFGALIKPPVAY